MEKIKTGLWNTESKEGKKYLKGKLTLEGKTYRLAVFRSQKRNENSPDFTLILEDGNYTPSGVKTIENTPSEVKDAYEEFRQEVEITNDMLPF